jgi:hypothetical protein
VFNTAQQIGGALGLAVLSTLAADRTTAVLGDLGGAPSAAQEAAATVDGFQLAFMVGAGLFVLGMGLVATLLRSKDVALIDEVATDDGHDGPRTGEGDAVAVPA